MLAIAAAKLGYSPVSACDHEPASLDAARTSAAANGVELDLARINLREQAALSAPTVAANLTAPVLLAVAKRLADQGGEPPDALICSGLLAGEVDPVVAAFGERGLAVRDRRADGEWRALLFAASSRPRRLKPSAPRRAARDDVAPIGVGDQLRLGCAKEVPQDLGESLRVLEVRKCAARGRVSKRLPGMASCAARPCASGIVLSRSPTRSGWASGRAGRGGRPRSRCP